MSTEDANAEKFEKRTFTLEDLRGRTPDEISEIIDTTKAQIRDLHQDPVTAEIRQLSDPEKKAMKILLEVHERAIEMFEEHRQVQDVLRQRPKAIEYSRLGAAPDDPYADVRRLSVSEARDRALRRIGDRSQTAHMSDDQKEHVERQLRRDTDIARRILVTENEHYREAWLKLTTRTHPILTPEEQRAVQAFEEYRVMAEGTTTAGGFGIPVFIDPSIILTAQESGNPFLTLAKQVTVNTNAWKGVTSAGVTWTFQTEGSTVTDASPVLAQPSVTVNMARGFIPFTIEVQQDYPAFADEMATLLTQGYDELLVDKFTRGTGTNEPRGILTALSANTNVRVALTTSGSGIGAPDPYKVWKALPQKFRRKANWLMSVGVNNAVRQLGSANVYHAYSINLPEEWTDSLFGKGVYESPYMPDIVVDTSTTGLAVVGDFSNYVIARRGGMSVELVPQLFQQQTAGTGLGMPTGQRGWFAYARIGGNSVNDLGFRLLVNQ
jgi:HK97 family phage major capsid protein